MIDIYISILYINYEIMYISYVLCTYVCIYLYIILMYIMYMCIYYLCIYIYYIYIYIIYIYYIYIYIFEDIDNNTNLPELYMRTQEKRGKPRKNVRLFQKLKFIVNFRHDKT